jgi:hypothetical protein
MIYYLATGGGAHTIRNSLARLPEDLQRRTGVVLYDALLRARDLPCGTYIFSDIERLKPDVAIRAAAVWHALERSGAPVRLLNHPLRSMRRFELLKTLHHAGVNDFDVHRFVDGDANPRFPVFLRGADDHSGSRTHLIRSPGALAYAARRLRQLGMAAEDIIIVEFRETRDANGLYRKYGAYRGGDQIIPTHIYFSDFWMLKTVMDRRFEKGAPPEETLVEEEIAYQEQFPHREELRRIFTLAGIDYGRVDYTVVGGRLLVWEINTNPDPHLHEAMAAENVDTLRARRVLPRVLDMLFDMFRSLDLPADRRIRIPIADSDRATAR